MTVSPHSVGASGESGEHKLPCGWQRAFTAKQKRGPMCDAVAGLAQCGSVVLSALLGNGLCGKEAITLYSVCVTFRQKQQALPAAIEPD